MRILHSSDWHFGQHFMGKTRHAEHQAFVAWLIEQVKLHAVDAVIVAGDIFDTGTPPSYARELYSQFVVALHETGAELVVLGGNHDSVATLGENKSLLAKLGARVIPGVAEDLNEQLLVLHQRNGEPGAILCGIPFIRPREVMQSQAGQSAAERQQSLQEAIRDHYQQLYALAEAKRAQLGGELPIIASGHLTTVGASASESVREIYVGALEAFPTNAFPPAAYIALGHIHRPQKVGGQEHIRYSGSPIPLSFDEARQNKEVLLVDLGRADIEAPSSTVPEPVDDLFATPDLFASAASPAVAETPAQRGLLAVTPLPVPCFQPLVSLRGSLTELQVAIAVAAEQGSEAKPIWLELIVTADDYLSDLQQRIEAICETLPVEVLRIRRERGNAVAALERQAKETLDELTPLEVFQQRLADEDIDADLQAQLQERYRQVLQQLQEAAS